MAREPQHFGGLKNEVDTSKLPVASVALQLEGEVSLSVRGLTHIAARFRVEVSTHEVLKAAVLQVIPTSGCPSRSLILLLVSYLDCL